MATNDPLCVINEARGTCSTKHALLKRLLDEQDLEGFELRVGIYQISEANTPGVGDVLRAHGLQSIPEAHCFVAGPVSRLDITRMLPPDVEPIGRFEIEEAIDAAQTTDYKRDFHRRYLAQHLRAGNYPGLSIEDLWRIREACIAALAA